MYFITFFMTVTLTCGAIAWQHKVCLFPWVHCLKFGSNSLFVIACCFNFIKNISWSFFTLFACSLIWNVEIQYYFPFLNCLFSNMIFFLKQSHFQESREVQYRNAYRSFFFILLAEYMYLVLETSHIYSFKSRVIKLLDLCLPNIICVIKIICTSILKFLVINLGNLSLAASIDI